MDTLQSSAPYVSIGMPIFNAEKYLAGAIESFINQDFEDFELIISDNASTDRSAEIARDHAASDVRIRYIRQPRNLGAVSNFAFVLREANGVYFQWAAHDDYWKPFWLKRAVSALDTNEDIEFAFPSFAIKDQLLGFVDTYDPKIFEFVKDVDEYNRLINFLALHFSHKCNLVYSLFRRDFILKATQIQGLDNDGVLAAVCLGMARGEIISGFPFIKRWGSLRSKVKAVLPLSKRRKACFKYDLERSVPILKNQFPSFAPEIQIIVDSMRPGYFSKGHKVVDVSRLLEHRKITS